MGPGGGGGGDDNGRTGHQRNEIISRENKKARTINRFLEAREISVKRQRVSDAAMNAYNRPPPVVVEGYPEYGQAANEGDYIDTTNSSYLSLQYQRENRGDDGRHRRPRPLRNASGALLGEWVLRGGDWRFTRNPSSGSF